MRISGCMMGILLALIIVLPNTDRVIGNDEQSLPGDSVSIEGKGNFTTIADAVSNATDGDEIKLGIGTYRERIVLDKRLSLVGAGSAILWPGPEPAVEILADGCSLEGLEIEGDKGSPIGILVRSDGNSIVDCTIRDFQIGMKLDGSSGNVIEDNDIESCGPIEIGAYPVLPVPMVRYAFDEGQLSSTAKDTSGSGIDALVNGKVAYITGGRNGNAAAFGGGGRLILTGDRALMLTGEAAISLWIRTDAAEDGMSLAWIRAETGDLEISLIDGHMSVVLSELGITLKGPQDLRDDKWHHLAVIAEGRLFRLYVDEISVGTGDAGTFSMVGSYELSIGAGSAGPFVGFMDEFAVFSQYLTPEEVGAVGMIDASAAIVVVGSNDNHLVGNRIRKNLAPGLSLVSSSRNTIDGCTFSENDPLNIIIDQGSSQNTFVSNWMLSCGNGMQSIDLGPGGRWNFDRSGNYWSDQTKPDSDGDGIIDIPYIVFGLSSDRYPLSPIADGPAIGSVGPIESVVGEEWTMALSVVDTDTADTDLRWDISTNATWIYVAGPELNGIPGSNDIGIFWVNATVTDGFSSDWTNFTIHVRGPQNDTISFLVQEDEDFEAGWEYWSGRGMRVLASEGSVNISSSVEGLGNLVLDPRNDWSGTESITVHVMTTRGKITVKALVEVRPVNDPPRDASIVKERDTYASGDEVHLHGSAVDPDDVYGDRLTYRWEIGTANFTGDSINVSLPEGYYKILLTVTDLDGRESESYCYVRVVDGRSDKGISAIHPGLAIAAVFAAILFMGILFFAIRPRFRSGPPIAGPSGDLDTIIDGIYEGLYEDSFEEEAAYVAAISKEYKDGNLSTNTCEKLLEFLENKDD